jgi:hypothetical protein
LYFANFDQADLCISKFQRYQHRKAVVTSMKILMDRTLKEIVEQAYEEARLGRNGDFPDRDLVFAEVMADLESDGDAMRYLLGPLFELVTWWAHERKAIEYARRALSVQRRQPAPNIAEPFAAVIFCTADPEKVDYRMRSKWSRVLRYAADYKDLNEPLRDFVKRKGGINKCAGRFARRLGRGRGN